MDRQKVEPMFNVTADDVCRDSILSERERQQVVELFNATDVAYREVEFIHELFEQQVDRTATAVAVVHEGESLTYAELNRRANQLAWYLRGRGVGPDQLVGICLERDLNMLVGLLGILKAGGAYVPLDPSYPSERLEHMVRDAGPKIMLVQQRLRARLPETGAEVIALDQDWSKIATLPSDNLEVETLGLRTDHLAYIIYTSGSTGEPKGVAIEHRNAVNLICWARDAIDRNAFAETLQSTSLNFDLSVYECFVPLSTGGSIRLVQNALAMAMEQGGVTLVNTVPSAIEGIMNSGCIPQTTRVVNLAGEVLRKELVDRIFAHSPVQQVCNLYGPSETTTYSTWISMPREHGFVASIGRPIANTRIYILDSTREPIPIGVAGEIYIGGAGVARGYLNRPELTAERFLRDPFDADPKARMYKTGDLGRWRSDGTIEYLGRNDHQVKVRGFRIELGEIEAQLLRHVQVQEAVVIAREDVPGEKRLVAYITPRDQSILGVDELRAHLKMALPEHMVPSAFVLLRRLPLTTNGKLDRRALPAPALEAYVSRKYEPPQGGLEGTLSAIWQTLLQVDRIGRHDNFFELGGHSLLIAQMMERLRQDGLSIELRGVYENPTLAMLANVLTSEAAGHFEVPPNLISSGCEAITPKMLPLITLDREHIERIAQAVPGGAANIQDIYPLGPLQEGILFHHLLDDEGRDTYVLPTLLSFSSQERLKDFTTALQQVINRHDVLRTAVLWERLPRPVQVVYRRAPLQVEQIVLDRDREPIAQLKERMRPEQQSLNLHRAPLIRMLVAADPRDLQWYALLQLHHLAGDHESIESMFAEVTDHLEGRAASLPEPIPYRNYVAQTLISERRRTGAAEAFFRTKLGEIDEPTAPFGLMDVHGNGSRIEEAHDEVAPVLARRIHAEARRLHVSAAMLFHAAWALVVARTSGRNDVVFGTLLLGRLQERLGAQRMLGLLINTLPLRLRLDELTAKGLVEQTQRELIDLLSHEQESLSLAQRCSSIGGGAPLFTTLLNYRHVTLPLETGQPLLTSGIQVLASQEWTNYPIVLSVSDLRNRFVLTAQTDRRIDPRRILGYISTALRSLVEALEEASQRPALSLPILPESEHDLIVDKFNATLTIWPEEQPIHHLIEKRAQLTPGVIAISQGGQRITYAELNSRSNRLARHLRENGVDHYCLVAIHCERSIDMVVGMLGTLKAGAAYVPLDPHYPEDRLRYMLDDAAPAALITQEGLDPIRTQNKLLTLSLDRDWDDIRQRADHNLGSVGLCAGMRDLAYVIYTSGSTGRPKGVMVTHHSLLNLTLWHCNVFDVHPGSRCSSLASVAFDATTWEVWPPLIAGATLVLSPYDAVNDSGRVFSWWLAESLDVSFLPTPLAELAFNQNLSHPTLKTLLVGGDVLRVRPSSASFSLVNNYGPTESTVVATSGDIHPEDAALHIGRPIANTQIYIVDPFLTPVPIDVPGEIYIGGRGVALGYLNRPELTAERFIPNQFSNDPHSRLYKTGDLGRWRANGTIEYMGRNDHQVKIRGYRIELSEIEVQLAAHSQVREVVVIAREDVPGEKCLVAYVTSSDGMCLGVDALRAHLKCSLPAYMIPSAFVTLERLPQTPNGKLDRRALPAPGISAYAKHRHEPAQGRIEQVLAEFWQELLRIESVSRLDNFFELGGHSLLVMRLMSRIRECLGVEPPIRDLFEAPTLEEFAKRVEKKMNAPEIAGVTDPPRDFGRDVNEMSNDEIVAEITDLQNKLTNGSVGSSASFVTHKTDNA